MASSTQTRPPRLCLPLRSQRVTHAALFVAQRCGGRRHAGNLMVNVDAAGVCRPVLLDFGMVVTLDEKTKLGYASLVLAATLLSNPAAC